MSTSNTTAELISYMSSRLLEVAEMNTILDQFGSSKSLPAESKPSVKFVRYAPFAKDEVHWKFQFKSLVTSSDWIRVVRANERPPYVGYAVGREDWPWQEPLETHELTAVDREALERMELF